MHTSIDNIVTLAKGANSIKCDLQGTSGRSKADPEEIGGRSEGPAWEYEDIFFFQEKLCESKIIINGIIKYGAIDLRH